MDISSGKAVGAGWTSPERAPLVHASGAHVGIDDAGRALMVYERHPPLA